MVMWSGLPPPVHHRRRNEHGQSSGTDLRILDQVLIVPGIGKDGLAQEEVYAGDTIKTCGPSHSDYISAVCC